MNQRRRSIRTIFDIYYNVYKDQCFSNKEVFWTASTPYEFYVTRNNVRVEGSERDGVIILIRVPYKDAYDAAHTTARHPRARSPEAFAVQAEARGQQRAGHTLDHEARQTLDYEALCCEGQTEASQEGPSRCIRLSKQSRIPYSIKVEQPCLNHVLRRHRDESNLHACLSPDFA